MEVKVLICSREDECRQRLMEAFSGGDWSVFTLEHEADLLLEILERDYHVVIYDMAASAFDGLKMVKILKKIRPRIALVVISDSASTELGGKVLQEGVAYYGVKPVNPGAIVGALSAVLSKC